MVNEAKLKKIKKKHYSYILNTRDITGEVMRLPLLTARHAVTFTKFWLATLNYTVLH